ncbi:MAG: ankyrin repeat domain-containing protein [Alphaproteobacteria bacterium]|nr:ankyrin repeat domain-containing protein [Alphaproteobacteria bacterium]
MTQMSPEKLLWIAARQGDCAVIRRLVVEGVDIEARDAQGRTALHIATQYGHMDARKTLMAAREMRALAKMGVLPEGGFSAKFKPLKTGTE